MSQAVAPVVAELESLLQDQPKNPLRPNQLQDWQTEIERLEQITATPAVFAGAAKGFARRRLQQIRQLVDTQAPKKLTDARRNRVTALCKQVVTEVLLPRMLTRAESTRNPPGAVGHQLKTGEFSKPFKRAALAWKRGMWALDPEGDGGDPDFTNYAKFQREGIRGDGIAGFNAEAQVPGNFAMSPLAKANWPFDDAEVKSALAEVKEREAQTPRPARAAKVKKPVVWAMPITCACGKEFRGSTEKFIAGNLSRHQKKTGHGLSREESHDGSAALA